MKAKQLIKVISDFNEICYSNGESVINLINPLEIAFYRIFCSYLVVYLTDICPSIYQVWVHKFDIYQKCYNCCSPTTHGMVVC